MQTKFLTAVLLSSVVAVYAQEAIPTTTNTLIETVAPEPTATDVGLAGIVNGALQTIESIVNDLPTSVLAALESAIPTDAEQQLATVVPTGLPSWFTSVFSVIPEGAQATILSVESALASQISSAIGDVAETTVAPTASASVSASSKLSSVSGFVSSALSSVPTRLATTTSGVSTTLKTSTTGTQTGATAPTKTGAASTLRVSVVGGTLAGLAALFIVL